MFKAMKWFAIGFFAGIGVCAGGCAACCAFGRRPSEWMGRFGGGCCGEPADGEEPLGSADDLDPEAP